MFKANNHIYKKHGFSKFDHTFARKKTHQNELEGWTPDRGALASGFGLKLMILACEHNNWLDMGCLTGKPAVHIQSTKAKYKDHSKGDAVETSSCACTRQENCTFQCSPNMRAVDCATVWVRKCLQLFYLPALHLTLFEIYIRNRFSSQSNKPVSFEQPATRMTLPMPMSLCGKKARKTSAQICASESHS